MVFWPRKDAYKMTIKEVIDALTNGVGEKPYCRRVDDVMQVFVADDQYYCEIAMIDEYDETIANAICEAGTMLTQLQSQLTAKDKTIEQLQARLKPAEFFETELMSLEQIVPLDCRGEVNTVIDKVMAELNKAKESTPQCRKTCEVYADWENATAENVRLVAKLTRLREENLHLKESVRE